MRYVLIALVVAAAFIGTAGPAAAQEAWEDQLIDFLHRRVAEEFGEGLEPTALLEIGALAEDESGETEFFFEPGGDYVILAVCDPDCEDIDVYLYGDSGEVASDVEPGPLPVIDERQMLKADLAGPHTIEVYMVSCRAVPCYYALGVFEWAD